MKKSSVPQHNISTYADNKKAMYATGQNGEYTIIASTGWNVEEDVTKQALAELERLTQTARREVESGRKSPLFFHMYNRRMDLQTLAQSTGLYKWRITRHFKPGNFSGLSSRLLLCYCEALGIGIDELKCLPQETEEP
jgi:hypothetical protein